MNKEIDEIGELTVNEYNPLWSIMIPTYNCAKYLERTLKSVLSQDLGHDLMQIEVIDDCSTQDYPEKVVEEFGKGRVSFFRQSNNVGATSNFNTCIKRSKGKLVHILHGDDLVLDNFYNKIGNVFLKNNEIGICICRSFIIDEKDEIISLSPRIESLEHPSKNPNELLYENPVRTPGVVVKREVYEKIGGFDNSLIHTADWEMWIRAIHFTKGYFINLPLVNYRYFKENDTSKLMQSGKNLIDYLMLSSICSKYISNIDQEMFKINVMKLALIQANTFKNSGKNESYKMNYTVYRDILRTLPIKIRFTEYVKMILKKFILIY